MYLRIGRKIINTGNMVDADVYEVGEDLMPYRDGQAAERVVVTTTTALEPDQDGTLTARRIVLECDAADLFIESLPVYAPVLEES